MATLRKIPPAGQHLPSPPPVRCDPCAARMPVRHPYTSLPAPLASGFQDFYTGRFQLALRLLKLHTRQATQRAITALLLLLVNLLYTSLVLWLFSLAAEWIDPGLWLCRLLLLVVTILSLLTSIVSSLFALRASLFIHTALVSSLAGAETEIFFNSRTVATGSTIFQDETRFRERFRQATQAQLLDGVISELYSQLHLRISQEKWLLWTVIFFAAALLLFTAVALGVFLAIIL